ncbi:ABC-three component system protein [Paenibacillus lautus]|uniref:ABC-three component system protein n=1 Tax=Paenibacillus lautus TaxID=1401 RepID=UPI001C0F56B7|nr:ABC-three component system protein [Paenibacillus lautus]MBU5347005.1 GPI inositol-deacylase [Paenibacillus lautus]
MLPIKYVHQNNNKNVVVFVHGFTGDSNTWKTNSSSFPEMLLDDKTIQENFDFMYFNYHSELVDFYAARSSTKSIFRLIGGGKSATAKNISITELGDHLKSVVEFYCSPYQNIIIVAHSMGGLVSKSFLLSNTHESRKVKMFLSLAVPHNGVDWATFSRLLFKGHKQLIDLQPLSSTLNSINQQWIKSQDELPKTIYFYGQFDEVVKQESAIAYEITESKKVACNDDHFSISKPESSDSLVFVAVKRQLLDFISNAEQESNMLVKPFKDEGQLDNELFVLKLMVADVHKTLVYNAKSTFFNAEYMRKLLVHQSIGLEELSALYSQIEYLYSLEFGKLLSGALKDSNELVTNIHQSILEKDREFLKTTIPLINAYHKTGMLHQLTNDLEKDLWWAQNNSIKDIKAFREAKSDE